MLKPKARQSRRYWESLSDEELIETDLLTDDPESLESLVYEIPEGDEETYVEFKYDLRKSGRDSFKCVHGNHAHLAGFVMRKAEARFLVGWMCGKSIYQEDFEKYTSDFDAAVNRQDALRRVRNIRNSMTPFVAWLESVSQSEAFKQYSRVRGQLREQMPWLYDNLPAAAELGMRVTGAILPKNLCAGGVDVRQAFNKVMTDVAGATLSLTGEAEKVAGVIGAIRSRLEGIARKAEAVLDQLKEVEAFFQPAALDAICKLANEHDNPKRRKYEAGLLTITCKRDRDKTTITMPKNFILPSRKPLEVFRAALSGTND
jgi:hypothetical protein